MKESKFIDQNKQKWADYEKFLSEEGGDPEKLREVFVEVTDDLSYARTFYPNRSVRVYLNSLGHQIFGNIYVNKRGGWKMFLAFWQRTLPEEMYLARKELFLSFLIFLFAVVIGMFSSLSDPDFTVQILGQNYVDMTLENIERGDPMGVYKKEDEFDMFLGITLNNLFVAFVTFLTGLFVGLGSIGSLIRNGIMLGSFQYFFIARDLFTESFFTVWVHGTLEISSIIIAAAAGIVLGKGILFPGTLTRMQSFLLSARRGLRIMLGTVPIFVIAGFIEGFLTRYTDAPLILRGGLILISLLFVLGYFVWFPWYLAQKGEIELNPDPDLSAQSPGIKPLSQIKAPGQVLRDTFSFLQLNARSIGLVTFIPSTIGAILATWYWKEELTVLLLPPGDKLMSPSILLNLAEYPFLLPAGLVLFAPMTWVIAKLIRDLPQQLDTSLSVNSPNPSAYFQVLIPLFVFLVTFAAPFYLKSMILPILLVIFPVWIHSLFSNKNKNTLNLGQTLDLLKGSWMDAFTLLLILSGLYYMVYLLISSELVWHYWSTIMIIFDFAPEVNQMIRGGIMAFSVIFNFMILGVLVLSVSGIQFYSLAEITTAQDLRVKIETFGQNKTAYGLEKEH